MVAFRRGIRAVTFAWLFCQVASLSAFVPERCCVSHAAKAAAKQKAEAPHEAAPPAPTEGDACPLHHSSTSHDRCAITNGCDGPGTQLTALFAYLGVVETPASSPVAIESTVIAMPSSPPLPSRLATPDAPPPKP